MKLYSGFAAAAAIVAIAGVAIAAETGKFVQQGDAAKALLEQNTINIATAEAIGKACIDEATKENVKVSVVITDQFGEPVWFYRMDGQGKVNVDTAFMKAKTALNMRAPSKTIMNQVSAGPLVRTAAIFLRQFRQFRRTADHCQWQPADRRDRRRRVGPARSGVER